MPAFETEVAPGRLLFGPGRKQWLAMLGAVFGLAGAGSVTTVQAGARTSPSSVADSWETPERCTPVPGVIILIPSCVPPTTLPALPNDDAVLARRATLVRPGVTSADDLG